MDKSFSWLLTAGVVVATLGIGLVVWALPGNHRGVGADTSSRTTQDRVDIRSSSTVLPLARPGVPSYQYNDQGQLSVILYPDGSTYSYSYDSHGDKTRETDRTGLTWVYVYDQHQHLLTVIDPQRHVTQIAPPPLGP